MLMALKEIAEGKYKRRFLLEPPKPPPPSPPEPPIEPPLPEPPIEVVSKPRLYHNSGLVSPSLQGDSTCSLKLKSGMNGI
jgi:hypothetical protein